MDETPPDLPEEEAAVEENVRRSWPRRLLVGLVKWLLAIFVGLLLLFAALVAFLDTGPGHRLIVDRIAAMTPKSGLRIRIGRIEGSIWTRTQLKDVRLYDPQGLFAESPQIAMDWRPLDFLFNNLVINEVDADLVYLHRMPRLIPAREPQPLLPRYDVYLGRLDVRQLRIGAPVTGRERVGSLHGEAQIRDGRALLGLNAALRDGGDRLFLFLDAEPSRDRFDLLARVRAPQGGVVGALLGTTRPIALDADGDGSWTHWTGNARLDMSGRRTGDFRLAMDHGRFRLTGWSEPSPFLHGKLQRLTAPRVLVDASGTMGDRRLEGRVSLRSASLRLESRGIIDLARGRYEGVQLAAELLHPSALFPNMTGRQARATAMLDGQFGSAAFVYRLASPHVAFDQTGFDDIRLEGRGHLSRAPVIVPVLATARRVTGIGDVAGGILANLRVQGQVRITPERLIGDNLALTSDKLRGLLGLLVDLRTGQFAVVLNGGMRQYLIPGLGLVDVESQLRAIPGPGGHGTMVTGHARAWVRRLDNRFLAWVGGGLPRAEADIVRGPDGIVRFNALRIVAPKLGLGGNGFRRRDGTFYFEGGGRHADYGPLRLSLDGHIDRPRLAVRLERPADSLGLRDVLLNLEPSSIGFAWRATGGSTLGPFTGNGAILLPRGQAAIIQVAALNVSGTVAHGALRSDLDGFTGALDVGGGGLSGRLQFNPFGGHQRIAVNLVAADASFAGPPPLVIGRGTIEGVILLDPAGTSVEGRIVARGLRRGPLFLANLDATASLRGGAGTIRARIAGSRGRDFAFNLVAQVAEGHYRVSGGGSLDRRPIELISPADLTLTPEGWRLAPTRLRFAGGSASLAGLFGTRTEIDAELDSMPLTLLDIAFPRLGLGGIASGSVHYREASATTPPTGDASLRIRGLTRAGLVLSSRPVDIGVNARLDGVNAAMRAVAVSDGNIIGRAQARISPIGGAGSLADRLSRAPMRAQIRYNGPADTLWRLTGIELIDLSGPAAIGADMSGTLENPLINGSVRTAGARLESAVTGMVIENLASSGRFGGSQLQIDRFSGTTVDGGAISGSGALDFAGANGVGMRFDVHAENARLLDRDDIRTAVTGDLAIRSSGDGGSISGTVRVPSGRFRLGSVAPAAQVARLNVREINRPDDAYGPVARAVAPWRLDLDVTAPNRMMVTGLGLNSEWRANVRVGGTVTNPAITGNATMLHGTYDFAGRRFDLIRGNIRFAGETPVNPEFDIAAEARVTGLSAQIRVTGRSQRPEIAFTSTPALPQDELLSRILFGTSITNLSAPEAVQLAAAVASLNDPRGGLDPINVLRRSIGLDRLRILPADVTQGIGTQIAAGKYLGRRVYVEVITDGRGYSATTVEYQITRWLSILSSISTIGRESVNVRVSRDY